MATSDSRLPSPFNQSSSTSTLITQGAEGLLFHSTFLSTTQPCALKVRPRKSYRHPTLDARLTRQRILAEARVLVRCAKEGVRVPAVLGADWDAGWLAIEWIDGQTVREYLVEASVRIERTNGNENQDEHTRCLEQDVNLRSLMEKIGNSIGKLHETGIIHGDLTTSNMMLQNDTLDVYLIDFGLATTHIQEEDRAVDLYVLERAWISTHPQAESLFQLVLNAYRDSFKNGKIVLKKLEEVRMRGRKKSMLG